MVCGVQLPDPIEPTTEKYHDTCPGGSGHEHILLETLQAAMAVAPLETYTAAATQPLDLM